MLAKNLRISFILSIIVWNSACTEIETETDPAPAGIYIGSITPAGGSANNAMAIISSTGDVSIINRDTGESLSGTRSENSITGTLYASTSVAATAEISLVLGDNISGTYSSSLGGGSFALTGLTTLYNRTSELSKLTGVWVDSVFTNQIGTSTWAILPDGSYTLTSVPGCNASGSFTVFNASNNEYTLTMNVTTCGALNGSYTGLAFLSDSIGNDGSSDTLSVMIANGTAGGLLEPIKQ